MAVIVSVTTMSLGSAPGSPAQVVTPPRPSLRVQNDSDGNSFVIVAV